MFIFLVVSDGSCAWRICGMEPGRSENCCPEGGIVAQLLRPGYVSAGVCTHGQCGLHK